MLKQDHRTVEKLFGQFQKAKSSKQKHELCMEVCRELTIHAGIEEKSFYPQVKTKSNLRELVLESFEEHRQVKTLVAELQTMKSNDELMQAKMKVLEDDIQHHVQEEERQMFPKLTKALGKDLLMSMGEQLRQDKMAMMGRMGRGEGMPMPQRIMEDVREQVDSRR
jgi:hemerythrin superfamily protein